MKSFGFLIFFVGLFITQFSFAKLQKYKCTITVTQTSDYCGGAAPSEEILQEASTPAPLQGMVLYVIIGKQNSNKRKVIKQIKTNENGKAVIYLPAGSYSIIDETQIEDYVPPKNDKQHIWDIECLKNKWKTPKAIFKVTKSKVVHFNVHKKCFYNPDCCTYTGPLPS